MSYPLVCVRIFIFSAFLLLPLVVSAQNYTVSGYLKDAKSGEALIGANIFVPSQKTGTVANVYGYYSLTIPKSDSLRVIYSYVGYAPQVKILKLNQDLRVEVQLEASEDLLSEVVISAERADKNVSNTQMSVIDIPVKRISELPAILGEPDLLKVVQLLPGVQAGQEGTTGFYVRGGNADQNLVQLDGATVYNPNHLFGLFSTFNQRALNKVSLIKGGFPAQYGGRLSSILDISMKEGNDKTYHVEGGIGLITSNITVEGPIAKERASFIVSARRTYLDLILKPVKLFKGNSYAFYDLNAKVNYTVGKKDRLFLSYFKGQDNASYTDASSLNYGIRFGNGTTTMRWNHLFNPKLFVNTSVIYNSYLLNLSSVQGKYYSQFYSGIDDINGKTEFEYFASPKHNIRFGLNYTYHTFSPTGKSAKIPKDGIITNLDLNQVAKKYNTEAAVYINDDITLSNKVGLSLGARVPTFIDKDTSYIRFEPRAAIKFELTKESSIKAAYTVMNQFLHIVPTSSASFPADLWIPSSRITKPEHSEQYAIGYFKNFNNNAWETSIEGYYKTMQNQVSFKEGTQLLEQSNIDQNLIFGKGLSYGIELFVKRNVGKLTGWVSYTLSKTTQQFPDLNRGSEFPFKYDRRHNISVVGVYTLNERWSLSGQFLYYSGSAYTLPVGRINSFGGGTLYDGIYNDFDNRNNARLNSYNRLDLSATYKKERKFFGMKYQSALVFSVYNIYSRKNPYYVYLSVDPNTRQPLAKQVSLLPIIPSVSYNFIF